MFNYLLVNGLYCLCVNTINIPSLSWGRAHSPMFHELHIYVIYFQQQHEITVYPVIPKYNII